MDPKWMMFSKMLMSSTNFKMGKLGNDILWVTKPSMGNWIHLEKVGDVGFESWTTSMGFTEGRWESSDGKLVEV
jgi:hypothetical protein